MLTIIVIGNMEWIAQVFAPDEPEQLSRARGILCPNCGKYQPQTEFKSKTGLPTQNCKTCRANTVRHCQAWRQRRKFAAKE